MTKEMMNEAVLTLLEIYKEESPWERTPFRHELALAGLKDELISRYEYARITGREAPKGIKGLVADESPTNERPIRCGGCGNCRVCCD